MIGGWIVFSISLLVFLVALAKYVRLVAFELHEVHGLDVRPVEGAENEFDYGPTYFGEPDKRTDEERSLGWSSDGTAFRFNDKTGEKVEFEPSDLERREIDLWLKINKWRSVFWWAAVVTIVFLALNAEPVDD
jgi:hypothetical protein